MKSNMLILGWLFFLFSCKQTIPSQLLVDRRVDFDTIYLGDVYRKAFILTNQTQDTVFIDKITHSCECIEVLNKNELKYILPKSRDSLIVLLTPQEHGYICRGVTFFLRDKQEPVDLIIEGYVKVK